MEPNKEIIEEFNAQIGDSMEWNTGYDWKPEIIAFIEKALEKKDEEKESIVNRALLIMNQDQGFRFKEFLSRLKTIQHEQKRT